MHRDNGWQQLELWEGVNWKCGLPQIWKCISIGTVILRLSAVICPFFSHSTLIVLIFTRSSAFSHVHKHCVFALLFLHSSSAYRLLHTFFYKSAYILCSYSKFTRCSAPSHDYLVELLVVVNWKCGLPQMVYSVQSRIRLLRPIGSNSPARMRHSVQIDTPLSPRARSLWRSFFLPFYRPTHSLCACLSACSDIYDMSH